MWTTSRLLLRRLRLATNPSGNHHSARGHLALSNKGRYWHHGAATHFLSIPLLEVDSAFEFSDHSGYRLLRIAEQHASVVAKEEWVINPREA